MACAWTCLMLYGGREGRKTFACYISDVKEFLLDWWFGYSHLPCPQWLFSGIQIKDNKDQEGKTMSQNSMSTQYSYRIHFLENKYLTPF